MKWWEAQSASMSTTQCQRIWVILVLMMGHDSVVPDLVYLLKRKSIHYLGHRMLSIWTHFPKGKTLMMSHVHQRTYCHHHDSSLSKSRLSYKDYRTVRRGHRDMNHVHASHHSRTEVLKCHHTEPFKLVPSMSSWPTHISLTETPLMYKQWSHRSRGSNVKLKHWVSQKLLSLNLSTQGRISNL